MRNIRIGDYLVSKGLITEEQLIKVFAGSEGITGN